MLHERVLEPETLDHLPHDDPSAERSRRDLFRINRIMGARGVLERAIDRVLPSLPTSRRLRVTELGAGDGLLLLDVARRWPAGQPPVDVVLVDRQPIVGAATIAAYGDVGWRARPLTIDVADWVAQGDRHERPDLVVANLFLHHFDDATLARLLAAIAERAAAVVAVEPRRSAFALAASRLVGVVGANAVTRRDAVLSVRAGFTGTELATLWPAGAGFIVDERDAGLFSHVFTARRG